MRLSRNPERKDFSGFNNSLAKIALGALIFQARTTQPPAGLTISARAFDTRHPNTRVINYLSHRNS